MFDEVKLQQGSIEWKEFRKKRVAASDVPIIMGISPYKTPYELAMEKLDLKKDEKYNHAMALGHKFEPKIRARVEIEMNKGFPDFVLLKKDIPWQMASLDGYNDGSKEFIEIKYMGEENFEKVKKDGPLEYHKPQLEMQFHVTGSKKGYYIAYTLNKEQTHITKMEIIPISPGIIPRTDMLSAIAGFYEKVILGRELPDPTDRDVMDVNNPELIQLSDLYIKAKAQLKMLTKDVEAIEEKLLSGASYPVCRIKDLKITSYMRKGNVDYKKVQGIDWEQYRKPPSLCRRITTPTDK